MQPSARSGSKAVGQGKGKNKGQGVGGVVELSDGRASGTSVVMEQMITVAEIQEAQDVEGEEDKDKAATSMCHGCCWMSMLPEQEEEEEWGEIMVVTRGQGQGRGAPARFKEGSCRVGGWKIRSMNTHPFHAAPYSYALKHPPDKPLIILIFIFILLLCLILLPSTPIITLHPRCIEPAPKQCERQGRLGS